MAPSPSSKDRKSPTTNQQAKSTVANTGSATALENIGMDVTPNDNDESAPSNNQRSNGISGSAPEKQSTQSNLVAEPNEENQTKSKPQQKAFYSLRKENGNNPGSNVNRNGSKNSRGNQKSKTNHEVIIKIIFRTKIFKEKFQSLCEELDQYVKNNLKCKINGSYFDKFKNYYVVAANKENANEIMTSALFFR